MKHKSWFTFIEVIIAITVFAIWVLAVLRLIIQNLVTLDTTQMRTTAAFLAKEGIELVYNMRDSNIAKWLPWDCVLYTNLEDVAMDTDPNSTINACMWQFSLWTNQILSISFDSGVYTYAMPQNIWVNFDELWSGNKLYYTTWTIWWHDLFWYSSRPVQSEKPTIFARYLLFTGVREWENILPRDSILKVESHVLYNKWTKTWEVVLESFIWNY